jgi:hypothetical protein
MAKELTPRGKALHWLSTHRGITEQPPGSNCDHRVDGIKAAQDRLAPYLEREPWCGVWHANALIAAGVEGAHNPALAGVANIEDLARARKAPYGRGWTTDPRKVLRGDAVVLFGRGVHVETVRQIFPRLGYLVSDGGNTTSGNAGDQANGGGSFRRIRRLSDVHGFALAQYERKAA